MSYPVLLALHIIFVVTWFAGLFYIVRLFVYHAEASEMEEPKKSILMDQFKVMEQRLWYGITWPSMILTLVFGTWLIVQNPGYLGKAWMHLKLGMVFFLLLYHVLNHILFNKFKKDRIEYSGFKMRVWNEVATIFLVAIVFTVVVGSRGSMSWVWGAVGLVIIALALYLGIKLFKRIRGRKEKGS